MRKVLQRYDESRRRTLLDSVSILSRQSVFGLLLVFLTAFSGSVWGAVGSTITSHTNIADATVYYFAGIGSSSNTYYSVLGSDAEGASITGNANATKTNGTKYTFLIEGGYYYILSPNGYYVSPGSSNGKLNLSSSAQAVDVSTVSSKIRISRTYNTDVWSFQKNKSNAAQNFGGYKNTQNDLTLHVAGYRVIYDKNGATGGTVPSDATVYADNATATIKANTGSLVKTGYTFVGWNTAANGSGTDVAASGSATKTITAGLRLYAKWEASSNPDVSLTPSSLENLAATDVEDQEITVACTNFANAITSVTAALYSNSTCTEEYTVDPWVTNISVNDAKTKVSFSVADNDGAARQAWLKVTATDGTSTESAILPISQKLYVAPLTTMDAIFAAATAAGATATAATIVFNNWVVSAVKNSNAYVTDGTKGFIIYASGHGFAVGNKLSGTAACKVQLYNGAAEVTELISSTTGLTVTTGGEITPVELDAAGIAALSGVNTGSVIKLRGKCTYESSKYYVAGVQLYNSLYSFSVTASRTYDVTGVYLPYNSTKQMMPRSAADIEEVPEPRLTVKNNAETPATITEMAFGNVGQRWQQSFVFGFSYENLEAGDLTMTIGGTNKDAFAFFGGELTETVNIASAGNGSVSSLSFRQATDVAGEYSATLTISGCGLLEDVVIPITMTVKAPEFSVSPSAVHFGDVKQHMKTTETFTLTGKYLSGDYSVKISAYGAVFDVLAENETYYIWPDENKEINETVTVICDARYNVDPNTYESHLVLQSTSLVEEFADIDNLIDFDATVVATYPVRFQVNDNDRGTITINGEESDEGGKVTVYVVDDNEAITMVANPKLGWKLGEWQVANADKSKVEIDEPEDAETFAIVSAEPEDYITAVFIKDCTPLDRPSNAGYLTTTYNSANLRWQWVWEDENKAATYHIHAFETENPSAEIDVDIELTSSEMEESNVYRTLTGLKGSTDYTIQIWGTSVADGFCPTGEVAEFELTTDAYPNATLTLSENGVTRSWGENLKVASVIALPTAPAVNVYGKTFVGWTNEANKDYSHATAAPAVLYAPGANYTVAAEADKLYAVYATATPGETVQQVIKHSVSSNTNLTEDENAATTFGLDAEQWTILGAKGGNSNNVGLNSTSKDIRLYYHSDGGNTLTITAPKTIVSASIALTENYTNAWVKVGGKAVVAVDGVYPINAKTFVIGNANTSNIQVRFTQVTVNLAGDPTYSNYATTGTHIIEWSAATGKAYTVIKDAVLPTLSNPESVEVTYSSTDETVATIDASTGAITPLKAGTTTIKATYQTVVVSYALTVYAPTSIAIGGELTKTAYEYGDAFDCSGLTATLTFGDEATADVTSLATWLIDGQASATVYDDAQFGVEVSYAELNDSESYDVTVNKHAVTFENPSHGTLVVKVNNGLGWVAITSGDTFVKGTTLKVEAEADEDYKVTSIYAGEENITESKTFTVGTDDVEVSANTASYPAANISWASTEPLVLSLSEASSPSNWRLLNNPGYFTVEVTSSNTDVIATMSKSGNYYYAAEVLSTGTTTITATFAGNDNFRETSVSYEVTIEKDDAGLAWSGVDGSNRAWAYMQGKEFTLPTLTNPNGLDVTYSCADGEGIITIDETTGAIELASEGAVHITATSAATDTYKAGSATYTLYVCGVTTITLSGDAEKKTYEYGEAFDRTGLTVTATYNNGGGTSDVTELVAWTYDNETITAGGSVHVTVNYANQTDDKYVYDIKVATHAVTWSSPEHGSLEVLDNTSNPFASGTKFRKGIEITVVPTAGSGYKLTKVTLNGETLEPVLGVYSFEIGTEDVELAAIFDVATGIDNAEAEVKVVKFIENGQIFIQRGSKVYTIDGQLVK